MRDQFGDCNLVVEFTEFLIFPFPLLLLHFISYLVNKSLITVYTIKISKHKNDRPQGIVSNNVGKNLSELFSLIVQLFVKFQSVILS